VEEARLTGFADEVLHREGAVKSDAKILYRGGERNGSLTKSNTVGGYRGKFMFGSYEHGLSFVCV
jgi:hypothetical protein